MNSYVLPHRKHIGAVNQPFISVGSRHFHFIVNVIEQEFTKGSNWNLGAGLSIVLMVFILISMTLIAKYDKNGEGTAF